LLLAYWEKGKQYDITDQDIRDVMQWAANDMDYPSKRGIPVERIDAHSLRIGGACALALAGYSDMKIQNMGQ